MPGRAVGDVTVISVAVRPEQPVEREHLYKQLVDLLIALTGRTEKFACLTLVKGDTCVRLADTEHDVRKGAGR